MATSLDERAITLASIVQSFSIPVSPGKGRSTTELLAWHVCSGLICKSSKQTTKQNSKENFGINLFYGEYFCKKLEMHEKTDTHLFLFFLQVSGQKVYLWGDRSHLRMKQVTRKAEKRYTSGTSVTQSRHQSSLTYTWPSLYQHKNPLEFSHFV